MSDAIRAAQVRAAENLVVQDLIAMGLVAAPQDKAHPTPPAVPSEREAFEAWATSGHPKRKFWSCGQPKRAADRYAWEAWQAALAAPVASNTTAEPAPIQPGVEVERDAAKRIQAAGRLMSNWCFNMAQRTGHTLDSDDTAALDKMRKQWDAAIDQALAGGAAK